MDYRKQGIYIRLVTSEEVGLLQDICYRAYSENFAGHWYPGGLEYYLFNTFGEHVLVAELKKTDIQYYIAYDGEEPVGFMKLILGAECLELDKLYILPGYKGRKIGHQLMERAKAEANGRGYLQMVLYVLAVNTPAIAFYERYGFRKYWETKLEYPYFRSDINAAWKMLFEFS